MRLSIKSLGLACGLFWGLALLFTAMANMMFEGYGQGLLDIAASVYPGYKGTPSVGQAIIGTGYALVDGFIGGVIFAWIYNFFAAKES